MCGVSAIISTSPDQLKVDILHMVMQMNHRGPDGNGTFIDKISESAFLALGHNRLSIVDLSHAADQPMQSQDGRYTLVFNGEIYNYLEIADELIPDDRPHGVFGDTAVVLASLIKWGPKALSKFNGMWAILLYDSVKKTLLVSRDRFGKKPLYYYQSDSRVYFSSEIKAILSCEGPKFTINPNTAIPYLTRGLLNCSEETFFEGVLQFPPASYQILDLGDMGQISIRAEPYWLHPFERGEARSAENVSVEEVRSTFVDAVRLRLRSDVPVGVLLSGGIDSSAIVGGIAELQPIDNLTVLSVISDDPLSSEEPFIDLMANYVHCNVSKVNVSNSPTALLDQLGEACWFNDEPVCGLADVAHRTLMESAHALGIKVLLSGQGADEQLGGYNKFLYFWLMELFGAGKYFDAAKTLLQFATHSNTLYEFRISEAIRYLGKARLASQTFIAETYQNRDTIDIGYQGSYQKREWIDLVKTSVPALLHYEDRMSMSHSVEVRVPFLDFRLVECLARVPPSKKFEGGWTKSIFRKAIDGLVPREIQYRRDKKGFNIPENQWMKTVYKSFASEMFNSEMRAEELGFIDRHKLINLYAQFLAGHGYLNGRHFFRVYAFEIFLRRFGEYIKVDDSRALHRHASTS